MSELKQQITAAMKMAMKDKQKDKLSTIRMVSAAIKQKEIDSREDLTDEQIIAILSTEVKKRKDAAEKFKEAGRPELEEKELKEIEYIQEFLPEELSENEIKLLVKEAVDSTQAKEMKDMGKIMGYLKPKVQGRADMGTVNKLVKEALS